MVLALLLSLASAVTQADPPIRVQLNHEQFTRGDRARVHVETAQDGHLVVLHADPDGRVRVLFPLDPSDDNFVRGGKRFEVRGRSGRDAFFVDDGDGAGTVLAVLSPDQLNYDGFVRNDHWDYRALATDLRNAPLAGLLDIAGRMAGETRFEYDASSYIVGDRIASHNGYGSGYYGYGYPSRFGVGLSFGSPWGYDPFCYDPFWGWRCGSRFGGFGYSSYYFGRPYYYSSYRPAYYRSYGYSRFGGYGRGFAGGSRFVMPRDRVRVTGVQPRGRVGVGNPGPTARGRAVTPRGVQPRGRDPAVSSRGGSRRGPAMSPRGGSGRGPSVSRPSNGSGGRAARPSGGTRSGGGGTRGGGGGTRRH